MEEELGELTVKQKLLVKVLEQIKLEAYFPYAGCLPGRPQEDRVAIARAFVAKMVYNMATTRLLLERQAAGQSLAAMLAELPKACNVGTKRNSKGHTTSWIGYKLHIDTADGGIPVSCLLTSASVHDSQTAIPLARISHGWVSSLYDMMDAMKFVE